MAYYEYPKTDGEPIISTKFAIPTVPHEIVARPHLVEKLDFGMQHKLTLLAAPAGSGKTTLLGDWASRRSTCPVAWLSLEENDNDLFHFLRYIITALEKFQPEIKKDKVAWQPIQRPIQVETVLISLVNAIMAIPRNCALILDDYHVISNQAIHRAILFFIDHLPPQMHLFISSRVSPSLGLSRLRSHSHVNEIQADELLFSRDEIKLFLDQVMGLKLPIEMIEILASRTEGWITGVQLAGLSLQRCDDISSFVTNFTGSDAFVFEYLAEEILLSQSDETQTFLLETAILSRFCGSLCAELTGQNSTQEMLEHLMKTNLFIVPLDHQHHWYRYQHLFREFLHERLQKLYPERIDLLHQRACSWYEQHGLFSDAIDHALAAKEMDKAAHLLMDIGPAMMRQNEVNTVLHWLEALPESLVRSLPLLCLLQAWMLMATGQKTDLIEEWLKLAQRGSSVETPMFHEKTSQLRDIQSMIATIRAHFFNIKGDVPHAIECAQQALKYSPQDDLFQRGLNELILGSVYWLNEDIVDAHQTFRNAHRIGRMTNNLYILIFALYGLETTCMARNQYQQAFKVLQQIVRFSETREECRAFWTTAAAYLDVGLLLYEWNDLDAAASSLRKGIALSKQWKHQLMCMYGNTLLARVKQAQGDQLGAQNVIQQTEQYAIYDSSYSWIVVTAEAQRIKLALMQGDTEAVEKWQPTFACNYVRTLEQITQVRIAMSRDRLEEAQQLLEKVKKETKSVGQKRVFIEAHVLQALVYQKQHLLPQALLALEHALKLAESEGYIRLFLDEGELMAELLTMAWSHTSEETAASSRLSSDYIKKLLVASRRSSEDSVSNTDHAFSDESYPGHDVLSKREREIVRLIALGMSNHEITQQIFIAESTVKWYTKNIYSKLGVHNRAQVVVRANQLHLGFE